MSWYVSQGGQQVWISRNETVFTVVQPVDLLPTEALSYLTLGSKKAVFQEHVIDDDFDGKLSKRRRAKMSGRQRGFIVRVEQEDQCRVVDCLKAAAKSLLDTGAVYRIDPDEAVNAKKKRNDRVTSSAGVNECRVETNARVLHSTHGAGFRVSVNEGPVSQKIFFYTRQEIPIDAWCKQFVDALEGTGSHVMLARRVPKVENCSDGDTSKAEGAGAGAGAEELICMRKDEAQQADEAWMESVMRGCVHELSDDEPDVPTEGEEAEEEKSRAAPAPAVQTTAPTPAVQTLAAPQQRAGASGGGGGSSSLGTDRWAVLAPSPPAAPAAPASRARAVEPTTRVPPPPARGTKPSAKPQARAGAGSHAGGSNRRGAEAPPAPPVPSARRFQQPPPPQQRRVTEDSWGGPEPAGVQAARPQPNAWQPRLPPRQEVDTRARQTGNYTADPPDPGRERFNMLVQAAFGASAAAPPLAHGQPGCQQAAPPPAQAEVHDSWEEWVEPKCAECGRGWPLRLYTDGDDGQQYCRLCWVNYYGTEPPHK